MVRILYIGNRLSSFGFTPTGIDFLGKLFEDHGYEVHYGGARRGKVGRLLNMVLMSLRSRRYDVMLIDTYSSQAFYYSLLISLIARLMSKPYVPILRGGDLPLRKVKSHWAVKTIMSNAASVVSVSRFLQHEFENYARVEYIPNFINIRNYPYQDLHQVNAQLLWVRSLHSIYNPLMAVKVLARLKEIFPNARLTMIGPDKDGSKARVERLAMELGVRERLHLTGRLPKEEWIRIAAKHDVFLNTTNFDNMPVSVIEAMALGLPVVSTNVGGIPYLLEDNATGLLVAPNDVETMVNKVVMLSENSKFTSGISRSARQKAEEFDEIRVLDSWQALFDKILS